MKRDLPTVATENWNLCNEMKAHDKDILILCIQVSPTEIDDSLVESGGLPRLNRCRNNVRLSTNAFVLCSAVCRQDRCGLFVCLGDWESKIFLSLTTIRVSKVTNSFFLFESMIYLTENWRMWNHILLKFTSSERVSHHKIVQHHYHWLVCKIAKIKFLQVTCFS